MATGTLSTDLLRQCTQLSDLSHETLVKLATIAEVQNFRHGDTVFSDMDPADRLYYLVNGEIHLCCELGSGEMRVVETVHERELFGWASLVEPYRCMSTALVVADSEMVAFDSTRLRVMCDEDIDLGNEVLESIVHVLANRLKSARIQLAAM